jgi:hypothetical protein
MIGTAIKVVVGLALCSLAYWLCHKDQEQAPEPAPEPQLNSYWQYRFSGDN